MDNKHYEKSAVKIEPIDLCERIGFNLGNVVKYLAREKYKGDRVGDLKKALYYWHRVDITENEKPELDDVSKYLLEKFSHDNLLIAELYSSILFDGDTLTDAIKHKIMVLDNDDATA